MNWKKEMEENEKREDWRKLIQLLRSYSSQGE